MSHIIPYIPTEPPSIQDDSFEQHSPSSEISDYNFPKIPTLLESDVNKIQCQNEFDHNNSLCNESESPLQLTQHIDNIIEQNDLKLDSFNSGINPLCNESESRSPLELRQHIDNIIEQNDLKLDFTDSGIKDNYDDDAISERSFEGQFDAYIDHVTMSTSNNMENIECMETLDSINIPITDNYFAPHIDDFHTFSESNEIENVKMEDDLEFDEFRDFNATTENTIDYFTNKDIHIQQDNQCDSFGFAAFDVTDSAAVVDSQEVDDDFDDFATFNQESVNIVSNEQTYQNHQTNISAEETVNGIVESFRQQLLSAIRSVDLGLMSVDQSRDLSKIQSENLVSRNPLHNEYGAQIWKELTNFDYSPAFIFHWMQSISYENFMSSMGPDYKELLNTQRATLPLYSVNLTPIEPLPADSFVQTIHSTTSSSLDLTIPDKSNCGTLSEKNSSIDIKNLEDEFIFNAAIAKDDMTLSGLKTDNRSSLPNLSSAVVQAEGLGGIFKSILKPLNPGKSSLATKPVHPQTEAVLKELPDLSYMNSKVLMFPVLASCDVEDSI